MSNTITAYFKGRVGVAESVYQYDYGKILIIDGLSLPATFEVHFTTISEDDAVTVIGQNNRVVIPNSCISIPGTVTAYIYLHTGENDGETEYVIKFAVIRRAKPDYDEDEKSNWEAAASMALAMLQNSRKVNTPLDEYNQVDNGTAGQLLRTKGDGSTEWVDEGLPTDEQTAAAVFAWLDEHPEATTTVEDGSLTEAKLANALKLKVLKDYVTPEMFGAKGDGVTDDTQAVQDAIDSGNPVFLKNIYSVGTITISDYATIFGDPDKKGTLKSNDENALINIVVTGTHASTYYITLKDFTVDGNNLSSIGILGHKVATCNFINLNVKNCVDRGMDIGNGWLNTINGCTFSNCDIGLYMGYGNCHGVLLAKDTFASCNIGLFLYGNASGVKLDSCTFEQCIKAGAYLTVWVQALFDSCTFENNGTTGAQGANASVILSGSANQNEIYMDVPYPCEAVTFLNCSFSREAQDIYCSACKRLVVNGCKSSSDVLVVMNTNLSDGSEYPFFGFSVKNSIANKIIEYNLPDDVGINEYRKASFPEWDLVTIRDLDISYTNYYKVHPNYSETINLTSSETALRLDQVLKDCGVADGEMIEVSYAVKGDVKTRIRYFAPGQSYAFVSEKAGGSNKLWLPYVEDETMNVLIKADSSVTIFDISIHKLGSKI